MIPKMSLEKRDFSVQTDLDDFVPDSDKAGPVSGSSVHHAGNQDSTRSLLSLQHRVTDRLRFSMVKQKSCSQCWGGSGSRRAKMLDPIRIRGSTSYSVTQPMYGSESSPRYFQKHRLKEQKPFNIW